jgi:hypothetical protein
MRERSLPRLGTSKNRMHARLRRMSQRKELAAVPGGSRRPTGQRAALTELHSAAPKLAWMMDMREHCYAASCRLQAAGGDVLGPPGPCRSGVVKQCHAPCTFHACFQKARKLLARHPSALEAGDWRSELQRSGLRQCSSIGLFLRELNQLPGDNDSTRDHEGPRGTRQTIP